MTRHDIVKRIFVVGVPRSGTTLVQSLLAAHSRLTSFTESHFFDRHFKLLPPPLGAALIHDPTPRVREFLAENGLDSPGLADRMVDRVRECLTIRWLLPTRTRAVARRLLAILDELALLRGHSSWVEKTPRHLRYTPFLARLDGPEGHSQFVHVIRGGLETVASLHTASRSWERAYDLDTCIRRWNRDVGFSLGRAGRPDHHFLFYEQLTARPEPTLARLFADLGLDWESRILDCFGDGLEQLITPQETWKAGHAGGVRRSGTSKRVLTAAQRDRVMRSLRGDIYPRLLRLTAPDSLDVS